VISKSRPIHLLNVIFKIVTKVLTTRLNSKLDLLIDTGQSGFIEGRYIMDVGV